MKKRILIFSLVYYPRFIGGAEVAVKEITDRISSKDIEFDMITMRKHDPAFEKIGNINVYRVGASWFGKNTRSSKIFPFSKYSFVFFSYLKALQLHRRNHYDLSWSLMANYAGFSALFFKFTHPKVPFLLTLQEGDSLEHIRKRVGVFLPLFQAIFKHADHIQAISKFLGDWARSINKTVPIDIIPNGVDIKKFEIRNSKFEKNGEIRKKLGIRMSDKVLITTSRLVEKNGVEDLVESLQYLSEDVKLLILGTGPLGESLKLKVESLKLKNRIFFLGFISHDEMPAYLHTSDIFIRPSLSEGLGNSFIEAMAAGLPVIATSVGGIPDFLVDPSNSSGQSATGLFCEVKNPKSIAEKVMAISSNFILKTEITKNARVMVEERYEWNTIAEKMKRLFLLTGR